MYVSITVNSKQYKAIFDIGASTTFMSEAFAKKTGVRLIADSLQIHGGITVYGQSGILDSMQIGDIIVRNIPITINKDTTLNKVEDIDFLIGADVMALLGEIQIFLTMGNSNSHIVDGKTCKWQQYIHGQSLSYTKRGKLWKIIQFLLRYR